MSKQAGPEYDDERLVQEAQDAVRDDELLRDGVKIDVTARNGVVTVRGTVPSEEHESCVVDTIRQAWQKAGLTYDEVEDDLTVR